VKSQSVANATAFTRVELLVTIAVRQYFFFANAVTT
jgi:hypothetical protein